MMTLKTISRQSSFYYVQWQAVRYLGLSLKVAKYRVESRVDAFIRHKVYPPRLAFLSLSIGAIWGSLAGSQLWTDLFLV
jgi:hypothetical protein